MKSNFMITDLGDNMVEIVKLPKVMHKFNPIFVKFLYSASSEIGKLVLKCIWKFKRPMIAKTSLNKRTKAQDSYCPISNLSSVLKRVWDWSDSRHRDPWARTESPNNASSPLRSIAFRRGC